MQKYLRLMNMRLDVVVRDITGLTGQSIIKAFIGGEHCGQKLAKLRHYNCRKSEEEIAKALQYNGRNDYLFALTQEWESYQHIQLQIKNVDAQINQLLKNIIEKDDNKKQHVAEQKSHKRKNKNGINNTDMNQISYQYFEGVDLMAIEGFNEALVMTLISEVGVEGIKKFQSAKQFTSWLRLAPNNKISGGKILSYHLPKGSSRLKIAFRNTANAIGNLKEGWLVDFFKRINYKKGRAAAVSALARKLAVIVWNTSYFVRSTSMITKSTNYSPPFQYLFLDEKRKHGIVKNINRSERGIKNK
jgi:transposase